MIRDGRVYKDGALRHEVHARTARAFLEQVYASEAIAYPKFYKMDALSQLGFLATELLLAGTPLADVRTRAAGGAAAAGGPDASGGAAASGGPDASGGPAPSGGGSGAFGPGDVGVILSNASASLDTDVRYYRTVAEMPSPALFVYTLPNIVIGEICIRHGFKGENAFFVFKAFHATFITQYVQGLFAAGLIKACVCGWVEVLDNDYDAALFLVEGDGALPFTADNLNKIYDRPWTN